MSAGMGESDGGLVMPPVVRRGFMGYYRWALSDTCRAYGLHTSGTKEDLALRLFRAGVSVMGVGDRLPSVPTGKAPCGCMIDGLHRWACASVGYVDRPRIPPAATPPEASTP